MQVLCVLLFQSITTKKMKVAIFLSFLYYMVVYTIQISESKTTIGNVFDLPTFDDKDIIEFYYLETSLPFNAPKQI